MGGGKELGEGDAMFAEEEVAAIGAELEKLDGNWQVWVVAEEGGGSHFYGAPAGGVGDERGTLRLVDRDQGGAGIGGSQQAEEVLAGPGELGLDDDLGDVGGRAGAELFKIDDYEAVLRSSRVLQWGFPSVSRSRHRIGHHELSGTDQLLALQIGHLTAIVDVVHLELQLLKLK